MMQQVVFVGEDYLGTQLVRALDMSVQVIPRTPHVFEDLESMNTSGSVVVLDANWSEDAGMLQEIINFSLSRASSIIVVNIFDVTARQLMADDRIMFAASIRDPVKVISDHLKRS